MQLKQNGFLIFEIKFTLYNPFTKLSGPNIRMYKYSAKLFHRNVLHNTFLITNIHHSENTLSNDNEPLFSRQPYPQKFLTYKTENKNFRNFAAKLCGHYLLSSI